LREAQDAARIIGISIDVLTASTGREIEAAFATMVQKRIEAVFLAGDSYFTSRLVQIATLAASNHISTSYTGREFAEAGGLMS